MQSKPYGRVAHHSNLPNVTCIYTRSKFIEISKNQMDKFFRYKEEVMGRQWANQWDPLERHNGWVGSWFI